MDIRIIRDSSHDAFLNMAVDESIFANRIPTLRFYSWEKPAVSLGFFQKAAEVNRAFLESRGIKLVRRLTGGKAVYHGQELTYSIVFPENSLAAWAGSSQSERPAPVAWASSKHSLRPAPAASVQDSYRLIAGCLLSGLKRLGLDVECREAPGRAAAMANCFTAAAWFEICVLDRKLAGSAQVRKNGMVLQQGSVLIDIDFDALAGCFPAEESAGAAAAPERVMTAIRRELEQDIDRTTLQEFLELGFREILAAGWYYGGLTAEEKALAEELVYTKYGTAAWNFRR